MPAERAWGIEDCVLETHSRLYIIETHVHGGERLSARQRGSEKKCVICAVCSSALHTMKTEVCHRETAHLSSYSAHDTAAVTVVHGSEKFLLRTNQGLVLQKDEEKKFQLRVLLLIVQACGLFVRSCLLSSESLH